MNPALTPATLFWSELALWICYVPASYAAYRWSRVPTRRQRDLRAIDRLDGRRPEPSARSARGGDEDAQYRLGNFLWPILVAMTVPSLVMIVYHPYTRASNANLLDWVWPDFLALGNREAAQAAVARFAFWGFGGAFLYSFTMIWRRYMAMDVTPNTYTYAGIRFLTSMFLGCTVGALLGSAQAMGGRAVTDRAMVPLCAVVFFIGMFPDFGLAYLRDVAKRFLGKSMNNQDEISLLCVSGLDLWHESRFRQDGINNAHNLANTELPRLVRTFPFPAGQLVSWVDEALLLIHVAEDRLVRLNAAGVYTASAVLRALQDPRRLAQLASTTGLEPDALAVLGLSLEQSMNMPRIMRFRGHYLAELALAEAEAPTRWPADEVEAEYEGEDPG